MLRAVGELDHEDSRGSDLRVLASEYVRKSVRDEFLAAAELADYVEDDRVSLRVSTGRFESRWR